jgi:hypothetical protein
MKPVSNQERFKVPPREAFDELDPLVREDRRPAQAIAPEGTSRRSRAATRLAGCTGGLSRHDPFSHDFSHDRVMRVRPALRQAATVEDSPKGARYEISVRGVLGEMLIGAFPGLQVRTESGVTVLTGHLPDQAALYGALAQLEGLGLELVEVRTSATDETDSESDGSGDSASHN